MSDTTLNKKITERDLRKVFWRWLFFGQIGWNYERMQGLCYGYSMMPVLRKLYTDEEDLKRAVRLHTQFFNTEPDVAHLILGANVALEEQQGLEAEEAIVALKTGLMGPFAGVGDTIFGVIIPTVLTSIGAYMALNGSSLGVWIWLAWAFIRMYLRWEFTKIGYNQGTRLVTTMGSQLQNITESASILGLTVVGALISTVVTPTVPLIFERGEVTMEIQGVLDQIMPSLIPAVLVFLVYWLLGRKGMTSTRAIWILLILSIIFGAFGILG